MKNMKKKGFTIVELVIVVAIISILSAVLIPTVAGVIEKANVAKDTQIVKNLNDALAADTKNDHTTAGDALAAAQEWGYNVSKINASAQGKEILWDSVNDKFCYFDGEKVAYVNGGDKKQPVEDVDYWVFDDEISTKYSTYLYGTAGNGIINTSKGLEVGEGANVTDITYANDGEEQTVKIITRGGALKINAENDIVNHFGDVDTVTVEKVDTASYHENGKVAVSLTVKYGHVVIESTAEVNELAVPADADATKTSISVDKGGDVAALVLDSTPKEVVIAMDAKVAQVIGATDVTDKISGAGSETVKAAAVTKTEVGTADALVAALADENVKFIVFTADITVSNTINIIRDVIIDGAEKTLTAKINTENGRAINVGYDGTNTYPGLNVTIKNLKVEGPDAGGYTRGLNIVGANQSINLYNCEISCNHYAINLPSSASNCSLNIVESKITGYSALNVWGSYTNVNITGSELKGINKSSGETNDFAVIVLEADTTEKIPDHTFNSTVIVKNSTLTAVKEGDAEEYIVVFNSGSVDSIGNYVELIGCTLNLANRKDFLLNDAPNTLIINGEKKN